MAEKNDGGPAFPGRRASLDFTVSESGKVASEKSEEFYPGMTLRQWYAGKALQCVMQSYNPDWEEEDEARDYAKAAFQVADAMIAHEAKEGK